MREIKFRQPLVDIETKDFKGFHYWGYDKTIFTAPLVSNCYANTGNLSEQFTGLHDKNGKEIYEGDIIRYSEFYVGDYIVPSGIEVVEYEHNGFNDMIRTGYANRPDWVEVIGNIHQTPELIEVA